MAQVLLELQARHGLACLYISHDLNFVSLFAQEILVMHDGRIVEEVSPQKLEESRHPETLALLEASRKLVAGNIERIG